jgi:hypothetical protein
MSEYIGDVSLFSHSDIDDVSLFSHSDKGDAYFVYSV